MEFVLRRCAAGDEKGLSLVSQATVLETYAGIAEGHDLYSYVSRELSVEKLREFLTSDRARAWAVETKVGACIVGFALVLSGNEGEPFSSTELARLYLFYRFHGLGLLAKG